MTSEWRLARCSGFILATFLFVTGDTNCLNADDGEARSSENVSGDSKRLPNGEQLLRKTLEDKRGDKRLCEEMVAYYKSQRNREYIQLALHTKQEIEIAIEILEIRLTIEQLKNEIGNVSDPLSPDRERMEDELRTKSHMLLDASTERDAIKARFPHLEYIKRTQPQIEQRIKDRDDPVKRNVKRRVINAPRPSNETVL